MNKHAEGLIDIGRMILTFAKVNRVTLHEDGIRKESDTDHTVMLSVCACALAEALYKDKLDIGMVAQFAIVHDLVESYALDTDSFGLSDEGRKAKEEREHQAYLRINDEFKSVYPWIPSMVEKYESLDTKEARFVKTVDKAMSKITHVLNNGQYFKNRNLNKEIMWRDYTIMVRTAEAKYGKEFPEVISLMEELMEEAKKKTYD